MWKLTCKNMYKENFKITDGHVYVDVCVCRCIICLKESFYVNSNILPRAGLWRVGERGGSE
jgi:hypothetical protein